MPRSIDRAALDRMTMMTMMMTRGDDGDDDPSPQIHIISHKVRHGPTRNMMESMVRHRPTTAQSIPNAQQIAFSHYNAAIHYNSLQFITMLHHSQGSAFFVLSSSSSSLFSSAGFSSNFLIQCPCG